MGKLSAFLIQFPDNPPAVFHPGDAAKGRVLVNLAAPMNVKAVRIRFRGEAYVHFTEKVKYKYKSTTSTVSARTGATTSSYTSSHTSTKTKHRKARETYYDKTFVLYGKGSGGVTEMEKEIPTGENLFPFTLNLRKNLPSSFEGKYGHVRFSLKATLVKPWKFNESTKIAFTVLDMVDLNKIPKLNAPVAKSFTKSYCCCCCKSGPIEVTIQLNKKGFVPGEYIAITGSIANFSTKRIRSTKAFIIQQVIYYAQGRRKLVQNKVAKVKGPGCPEQQTIAVNKLLRVPALPPTMNRHCGIIEVEYFLRFVGKMSFLFRNLQTTFAITVGSVPFMQPAPSSVVVVQNIQAEVMQPTAPPLEATAPPLPAPEPQLPLSPSAPPFMPPPSYEQSVSGAVNIRDADDSGDHFVGNTAFAPQYVFYNCSPPEMPEPQKKLPLPAI